MKAKLERKLLIQCANLKPETEMPMPFRNSKKKCRETEFNL